VVSLHAVLLLFAGLQPADGNADALGEVYLTMDVTDTLLQSLKSCKPPAGPVSSRAVPEAVAAPATQQSADSGKSGTTCQCMVLCIEVGLVCQGD
jgi:hypothetical protein